MGSGGQGGSSGAAAAPNPAIEPKLEPEAAASSSAPSSGSFSGVGALSMITDPIFAIGKGVSQGFLATAASDIRQMDLLMNAQLAERRAVEIMQDSEIAVDIFRRRKVGKILGSQRAAYAGQGVDVHSGSAADVRESNLREVAEDAMTIRNNAWRIAMGHKFEAIELRSAAVQDEIAADFALQMGYLEMGSTLAQSAAGFIAMG